MPNNTELVESVRAFIGTPFGHRGRQPGLRLDCVGVGVCALRAVGLTVEDVEEYSHVPDGTLVPRLNARLIPIDVSDMGPGCIVAVHYKDEPSHIGLLAELDGQPTIIHAGARYRKVDEHHIQGRTLGDGGVIVRAWRVPGVDY